jgi:hypothetical protein
VKWLHVRHEARLTVHEEADAGGGRRCIRGPCAGRAVCSTTLARSAVGPSLASCYAHARRTSLSVSADRASALQAMETPLNSITQSSVSHPPPHIRDRTLRVVCSLSIAPLQPLSSPISPCWLNGATDIMLTSAQNGRTGFQSPRQSTVSPWMALHSTTAQRYAIVGYRCRGRTGWATAKSREAPGTSRLAMGACVNFGIYIASIDVYTHPSGCPWTVGVSLDV